MFLIYETKVLNRIIKKKQAFVEHIQCIGISEQNRRHLNFSFKLISLYGFKITVSTSGAFHLFIYVRDHGFLESWILKYLIFLFYLLCINSNKYRVCFHFNLNLLEISKFENEVR